MVFRFSSKPRVTKILGPDGTEIPLDQAEINVGSVEFDVPSLQVAEVYVSKLMDRETFRRHCDRYKTKKAILANLR